MKAKFVKIGIAVCIIIVVLSMILLISEVISCRKKLQIQKLSADRFCYPEQYPRPEIYDRSGVRLIGNRRNDCLPSGRWRYAAIDGKFAAGLLGFTQVTAGREIGKSGIERMIDRKNIPGSPTMADFLCSGIGCTKTPTGRQNRKSTWRKCCKTVCNTEPDFGTVS